MSRSDKHLGDALTLRNPPVLGLSGALWLSPG